MQEVYPSVMPNTVKLEPGESQIVTSTISYDLGLALFNETIRLNGVLEYADAIGTKRHTAFAAAYSDLSKSLVRSKDPEEEYED
jgi:hypothetical protein